MPRKHVGDETTFEMLRAFVSLSETLNLTKTANQLGTTRQTVRRHIAHLEERRGAPLFSLARNTYRLSPVGRASLEDAKYILRQTARWSDPRVGADTASVHLQMARLVDEEGREFLSQQHPVASIAQHGSPLIRKALADWGCAGAQLEAAAMKDTRPYLIVFRKDLRGWLCVEIGETSAYRNWFGWARSKSAIGRFSYEDGASSEFDELVSDAYAGVYGEGGVRLDHLFAHLPRDESDTPVPVTFQRLLMCCQLPDRTPVLAVLVVITRQVKINGLAPEQADVVPRELEMGAAI